jgi:hypothetical protein
MLRDACLLTFYATSGCIIITSNCSTQLLLYYFHDARDAHCDPLISIVLIICLQLS